MFEKTEVIREFLPDDHLDDEKEDESVDPHPITDIAFLGSDKGDVLQITRKSRTKSLLLVEFLLRHVVPIDMGWHGDRPAVWLREAAQVRQGGMGWTA